MKILIAAGGTGGHVYPALAVAQTIRKKNPDVEIVFVGTKKGFEASIVPSHGFPIEFMEIGGIHSVSLGKKIKNLLLIPGALITTNRFLKKHSPDVVFGIGGYVSGLLLLLAKFRGIHTAILEPNVVAGATNKSLGRFVEKIFIAFDETKKYFPIEKIIHSGNPIRDEILKILPPDFTKNKKTIFIFGGSQGARKINLAVMEMIQNDADYWKNFSFIHQTGLSGVREVSSVYQKFGIQADVREYFDQIMDPYSKAHFVIARAGSSILEIASVGIPSVLIPYPFAAGHQLYNAQVFVENGAAYLLKDDECAGRNLSKMLKSVFESPETLRSMSQAALKFRNENAAGMIADQFLGWMKQ